MIPLQIRSPIWGKKAIGVAQHRLPLGDLLVEIMYTRKSDGYRSYPHIYRVPKANMSRYLKEERYGVTLILIPISDLIVEVERNNEGKA